MPERACEVLRKELVAQRFSLKTLQREVPEALTTTTRRTPQGMKTVSCWSLNALWADLALQVVRIILLGDGSILCR